MPSTCYALPGLFSGGVFRTSAVPQQARHCRRKGKAAAAPLYYYASGGGDFFPYCSSAPSGVGWGAWAVGPWAL
ncbi:MAG: hypothetical protein SFV55_20885 [Haliscomenobacter sp.]|uniref:hypothetical protein n=1 Tax=Haliscomenobacter sp. TaxID=2717303 RepID=UPI0029B8858D|nr:hypothetical protein [Haliscomenobacter sp.]MDX2070898.1 hypothetical protein [Haliscomenobacter sp.]